MNDLTDTDWARLRRGVKELEERIANLKRMIQAGRVHMIYVRPCEVKAHNRQGYMRICYPRRKSS